MNLGHAALPPRLGVDVGRVIIAGDGPDSTFLGVPDAVAMRARAVEGSFAALGRLSTLFDGRVWLVSKCGIGVEARTRAWLAHHAFFRLTGIDPEHLRFCRTRPEKAPICARLGASCFVDDRRDVIDSLRGVVRTRLLFGAAPFEADGVVGVPDWAAAEAAIVASLVAQGDG